MTSEPQSAADAPAPPVDETIVAVATPPGRGGIGLVRLSGPEAFRIAQSLVLQTQPGAAGTLRPRHAHFLRIADPERSGEALDEGVLTLFPGPKSYTGEDVAELAAHGSPVVLEALVRAAQKAGARLARPGEFTQRAFVAGRLDLTQAEAVHDLIAAHTLEQARSAAQQLGGALARRVAPAKDRLVHLIALLEAGMDFASGELDDVDVVPPNAIAAAIREVQAPLEALARSYRSGHLLRTGAAIALVGRPNAGKSSLFNRLLDRERAIVTAIPGTTRDTVEEAVSLGGMPLRLIDTAGLRQANDAPADEVEALGIARSHESLADADLVLVVLDSTQPLEPGERDLLDSLEGRPHLVVRNKIDLRQDDGSLQTAPTHEALAHALPTSALTGEGLLALRDAMLRELHAGGVADSGALNNLRQQETVADALEALEAAAQANAAHLPHEILLMDLHRALQSLDALTGVTTTDDILGRIFSTFCIGK